MPTATEYNQAIQNLRVTAGDEELQGGEPVLSPLGLPLEYSGNFAIVYQVQCPKTRKTWAVKCFTKEVDHRRERYEAISQHLRQAQLPFMVGFQYQEKGLLVGGRWYPIVKMDWVEGEPLNVFVERHLDKPGTLRELLRLWVKLAKLLDAAQVTHADLQHGNVLLVPPANDREGPRLRLVDYDGMHVPALAAQPSGELGHRSYQHPQRLREGIYSADVDRFSHLAIYCAMHSLLAGGRQLWDRFDNGDNLLFRDEDFGNPHQSPLFQELWSLNNPTVHVLVGRLLLATQQPLAEVPLLDEMHRDGKLLGLRREEEQQAALVLYRATTTTSAAGMMPVRKQETVGDLGNDEFAGDSTRDVRWASVPTTEGALAELTPAAEQDPLGPTKISRQDAFPANRGRRGASRWIASRLEATMGLLEGIKTRTGLGPVPTVALSCLAAGILIVMVTGFVIGTRPIAQPAVETAIAGRPIPQPAVETAIAGPVITNSIGMKHVLIPPGEFLMGSPDSDSEASSGEKPQHRVQITKPFYLGVYEVTQAQYQKVVGSNPSIFKGESLPVETVSWDEAVAFCKRLSEVPAERAAGRSYRLPTEAEWEYACRAGSTSKYSFGESETELGKSAWYDQNSGRGSKTHPVGEKQANAWGLHDMHGNVWEWCQDWYGPYEAGPASDPSGPGSASDRVRRGGSSDIPARLCRSADRYGFVPAYRISNLGFRVAGVRSGS